MKNAPLFSERFGFTKPSACTTEVPLPRELRAKLWDYYYQIPMEGNAQSVAYAAFSVHVWTGLINQPSDELSSNTPRLVKEWIKGAFKTDHWTQVFNIIEFTFSHMQDGSSQKTKLRDKINDTLSDFSSPWRVTGNLFVPISDEEQRKEIDAALNIPLEPVKKHLGNALRSLRDSSSPTAALDSIRESIHAVESMCQLLTGDPNDSLGKALNKLKRKIAIPEELEHSLHKLYGFTSNAQGVRHAIFDEANLTLREARFMVVACSAFVTYLWDLAITAGLDIAKSA